MSCRKRCKWYLQNPKFKKFLGEHTPPPNPAKLGRLRRYSISSPRANTFKISRYPPDGNVYLASFVLFALIQLIGSTRPKFDV